MNKEQELVKEFHVVFGLAVSDFPRIPDDKDIELWKTLIKEEFEEFVRASDEKDLVGVADAIGDLLYVVYGASIIYGIDSSLIFNEVHRSNMSKVGTDGVVRRKDDGKIIKPITYSKADIESILYIYPDSSMRYEHIRGNKECTEGWCSSSEYPKECECGGLIHADFGDENADGDYWLYTKCDKCGESE